MGQLAVHASRPLAFAIAPILLPQGALVRRRTPVLPEADGERHGVEGVWRVDALELRVLGESTAAGVGVRTQANGLAPAIAAGLTAKPGRPVSWRIAARTGTTAQRALTYLVPQLLDDSFDVVVVALGVNDVLGLRPPRAWQDDVAALVTSLQRHLRPGGGIVMRWFSPECRGLPAVGHPPGRRRDGPIGESRVGNLARTLLHRAGSPLHEGRLHLRRHPAPTSTAPGRLARHAPPCPLCRARRRE
jgi:hypothetical protein